MVRRYFSNRRLATNRSLRLLPTLFSASLLPCLIGALQLWPATGAGAQAKLDLSTGFDNNYRAGTWTPLNVKVSNAPSNAPAQLQVQVRSRTNGTSTYTQTINLHSGSNSDQYTAYYLHPESGDTPEINVQIILNGRQIAEKKLEGAIPISDNQPAVVGLTQDQSGLNFLSQIDLGIVHRDGSEGQDQYNRFRGGSNNPFQNPGGVQRSKNPTRVIYPRASTLPSSAYGYESIDAVALGDMSLDSFTEDQWAALVRWVKDGGVLIVSGGGDVNRARSKLLTDILPLKVTGAAPVRSLSSLADLYGSSPKLTTSPVLTGTLAPDSYSVCQEERQSIISARRVGNGVVYLTSFDLLSPEFRAWPGQANLWQDLLQRNASTVKVTRAVKASNQPIRYSPWTNQSNQTGRALTESLAGIQSVEAPPFQYIGFFLLAYIICLVPVNYLLLKKWDKKELAWITAPIIIFVFSIGAYAQGYRIKGGQLYLRSCSVVEGAANTDGFSAYTVASIFSPRQDRYNLSVSDGYALPAEVLEGNGFQQAVGDIQIDRSEKTTVKNALVNMWDHRSFAFESHVNLGGSVSASLEQTDSHNVKINISNNTKFTLNECAISFRGTQAIMGVVKPGEAKTVKISLDGNNPNGISIVSAGTPGESATELAIKQALAGIAAGTPTVDTSTGESSSPLVLTGWFNDEVTGLTLDSDQAKTTNVNLLVVHLPTPNGFTPTHRAVTSAPIQGSGGGFNPQPNNARINVIPPQPMAQQQPQNANYYNNLAYTYANQGNLNMALQAAQQALKLAPQDGNILDSVAEMHQRRKEYKQAVQFYALAISHQTNGGLTETHEKYGEALISVGDKANGVRHLQRAAQDPNSAYGARAVQALQKLGAPTTQGSQSF